MRLSLSFSASWQLKEAPGDQLVAILPGPPGALPELVVTYGRIVIKPDEPAQWLDMIQADAPAGTKVQWGKQIDHVTGTGWPVRVIEAALLSDKAEPVEARICALYTFMEHGAIAIIRAARAAQLESHRAELLALIESGRPDWRDVPVCLADAWDLERKRKPAAIGEGSALEQVRRGISALDSGSHEEAALAFRDAIALDDKLDVTHHWLGVALGGLGKHAEAIAAWERALELAPDRIDTRYNIAQARYLLADFEGALREFQLVIAAEPSDVLARRKVIQCLYALGRFEDGEREREAFRNAWRASSEPRVRLVAEYVFDQFAGDGFWVLATEHLAPQNGVHALLTFRAVRRDADRSEALPASVLVETSEQARAAGTPFVLALLVDKTYKVIGAAAQLPPYARLRHDVAGMLADALRTPPA